MALECNFIFVMTEDIYVSLTKQLKMIKLSNQRIVLLQDLPIQANRTLIFLLSKGHPSRK